MTTYVVVGYPSTNLSPVTIPSSSLGYTFNLGMPATQQVLKDFSVSAQSLGYTFGYGLPLTPKSLSPVKITAQDFRYVFRFFYPSNGKIPGSPIPQYGQIAPRPI